MSDIDYNEDIRFYFTEDEAERLLTLVENAKERHPCDKRLKQLLASKLDKHLNRKGGIEHA